MRALRMPVLAVLVLMLAAGCSLLRPAPMDQPTLHLLDARPAVSTAARRDVVLAVAMPAAAAGYDSPAMLYVQRDHALERYATHRWADAPARLLGPLLVHTLDDTGAFRAVVSTGGSAPADLRLDTEIVRLHQNFIERPSRVELTLRVQLVDIAARRVLAARYLEQVRSAPSDDAAGGVAAANSALAQALAQLAAWCVEQAAQLRP
jgi:cholesterol transport system auxiliary component